MKHLDREALTSAAQLWRSLNWNRARLKRVSGVAYQLCLERIAELKAELARRGEVA